MSDNKIHSVLTRLLVIVLLFVLCLDGRQTLEEQADREHGLIDMSLEELMEVQIMCDSESTNPSADFYRPWIERA